MRKVTLAVAVSRFSKKHGNKYTYPYIESEFESSASTITIKCPKHGEFKQGVLEHYKGQGCKKCGIEESARKRSIGFKEIVSRIESQYPNKFDFLEAEKEYKSVHCQVTVKCNKHNHIFRPTLHNLANGHGCHYCGIETNKGAKRPKLKNGKPQLLSDFLNFDKFDYPELVDPITTVVSPTLYNIAFVCKKHNVESTTTLYAHHNLVSNGCEKCLAEINAKSHYLEDVISNFSKDYPDYEIALTPDRQVSVKCPHCGSSTIRNAKDFKKSLLKKGLTPCKKCNYAKSGALQQTDFDEFMERATLVKPDFTIKQHSKWKGSGRSSLEVTCDKGHTWINNNPNDILLEDRGCPVCTRGKQSSKGETELATFIKDLGFDIIENSKTVIGSLQEIDVYVPSLKVAFEYNGVYYHSDQHVDKNYHKNKTDLCNNRGIRLIHIWEDDWTEKQDIVKGFIKHALNKTEHKIFARKCTLSKVDKDAAFQFLENVHIQGFVKSSYHYGLTHNNELVAVMSFQTNNTGVEATLTRYASKNVLGGFSKLLKHAIADLGLKKITTFCDLAMFTGDLYINNGFKQDGKLLPDYKYTKKSKRYHKFNYRKNRIKIKMPEVYDESKTEFEMMKAAGFNRIYDCGKIRYVLNL